MIRIQNRTNTLQSIFVKHKNCKGFCGMVIQNYKTKEWSIKGTTGLDFDTPVKKLNDLLKREDYKFYVEKLEDVINEQI